MNDGQCQYIVPTTHGWDHCEDAATHIGVMKNNELLEVCEAHAEDGLHDRRFKRTYSISNPPVP